MTRFQAWLLHLSVVALTITGAVFAWMRYAMKTDDPFAVANHPWQPHMLHLHVIAAPIAVFAFGAVFSDHIWPKYENAVKARRKTGVGALWMLAPMVLSGYLMQVVTSEGMILAMKVTHWVSSGLFVVAYLAHQLLRSRVAAANGATAARANGSLRPVPIPVEDGTPSTETARRRNG